MAQDNKSAAKVLAVLDVLSNNFFHGYSAGELVQATGYSASDITRYVNTLINSGFAERITETGRIRPSHRFAQKAIQIMNAINQAERQLDQLKTRIER